MANPTFKEGSLPRRKQPSEPFGIHDSVLPVEGIGHYNETPPSLADGEYSPIQMDDLGNLKMAFGDPAQLAVLSTAYVFPVPMGWKRIMDLDGRTDGQAVYLGLALMDAATSDETWYIFKYTYDGNFNTLIESVYGAWDDRAILF